jgi:hypothetical protein
MIFGIGPGGTINARRPPPAELVMSRIESMIRSVSPTILLGEPSRDLLGGGKGTGNEHSPTQGPIQIPLETQQQGYPRSFN